MGKVRAGWTRGVGDVLPCGEGSPSGDLQEEGELASHAGGGRGFRQKQQHVQGQAST